MPDDPQEPTSPPPNAPASQARYVVQEPIGNGGMGQVFRAWDQHLGRNVAVKRISEAAGVDAAIRREAGILAALHHPNIVTIFDFAADEEGPFVVMEYVEGRTLEDLVIGQPLDVTAFLELANQVCRGLSSAHAAGLLHLDIKPGNIMLQLHRDGSFTSKILDFGLARAGHEEAEGGEAGELFGSPYTVAPEQLARETTDARTDIYSLGCVFYFALSGKNPFEAPSVSEILQRHMQGTVTALHLIAPRVPPAMSQVIGTMIAPLAADRPQTMEDVRALLLKASRAPVPVHAAARRAGAAGGPVPASRPAAGSAAAAPARRQQSGEGGGMFMVLALLVLAGAGAWWFYGAKLAEPVENADAAPMPAMASGSPGTAVGPAGVRPVLNPGDAAALARHRGDTIVVEGMVASAMESDLFHALFLKFGNVPDDAAVVSVREDVIPPDKARSFVGKRVRATGKVATVAGVKRVVVEAASDLTAADGL